MENFFLSLLLITLLSSAHAADKDLVKSNGEHPISKINESIKSPLKAISQAKVNQGGYQRKVDQYSHIADHSHFLVYTYVERENLSSILKNGFYKRIGGSGFFESPVNIALDKRKISQPIVLAFVVERKMLQRPDDNGLGVALSPETVVRSLPELKIFKTADIGNYVEEISSFFRSGKLGRLDPSQIDLEESLRATASEFQRHDQATYEHIDPSRSLELGELSWDDCVMMAKAVFMEAVQSLKYHPVICSAVLGHVVKTP